MYLGQGGKHRDPGQSQLRNSGQSAVDNTVEGDRSRRREGRKETMDPRSKREQDRCVRTVMSESGLCLGLLSGTNRYCLSPESRPVSWHLL